jgi:hypothetical protein
MSSHSSSVALLNEISNVKRSGELIRNRSPVLRQWPWENGIALERGSMANAFQRIMTGEAETYEQMVLVRD